MTKQDINPMVCAFTILRIGIQGVIWILASRMKDKCSIARLIAVCSSGLKMSWKKGRLRSIALGCIFRWDGIRPIGRNVNPATTELSLAVHCYLGRQVCRLKENLQLMKHFGFGHFDFCEIQFFTEWVTAGSQKPLESDGAYGNGMGPFSSPPGRTF